MVGVLLAGLVAFGSFRYRRCPKSTIRRFRSRQPIRAPSPDVMASSVTAPLERQFGQMPGLQQMTSTSSTGLSFITLQFDLELSIDVAEQEVQQSINGAGHVSSGRSADAADLQQGESGRCADSHAGAHVRDPAALHGRRSGRHAPRAENLAAARRRTRHAERRSETGGSHPREPDGARVVRLEPRRRPHGCGSDQRQPGQRQLRRPAAELSDRRQRSAAVERRLRGAGRRLQERRTGAPEERRDGPRFRRRHPPGGDDEPHAGGDPQRAAAAGRQHHHGRRSHQDAAADADRARCRPRSRSTC